MAGEAAVADRAGMIAGKPVRCLHRKIGEGIRADLLRDFLYGGKAAGDQVFPGIHIRPEETGIPERGRGDPHVDFLRTGLPK